jgi:hypothetical protein
MMNCTYLEEFSVPTFAARRRILIKGGGSHLSMCLCSQGLVVCAGNGIQSRLTLFGPPPRAKTFLRALVGDSLQSRLPATKNVPLKPVKGIDLDGSCKVYGSQTVAPVIALRQRTQFEKYRVLSDEFPSDDPQICLMDLIQAKTMVRLPINRTENMVITSDGKNLFFMDRGRIQRVAVDAQSLTMKESSTTLEARPNPRSLGDQCRLFCSDSDRVIIDRGDAIRLYAVNDLSKPRWKIPEEDAIGAAAIDPITKQLYVLYRDHKFRVYTSKGVLIKQVHLPEADIHAQILVAPKGHQILILTRGPIYWIAI